MITDVERELLGQLILKPSLLESCEEISAALFSDGDHRKAFGGITTQWEELRPKFIDVALLSRATGLSETWLMGLTVLNFGPPPATFRVRVHALRVERLGENLQRLSKETGDALVTTGECDTARLATELDRARAILDEDGKSIKPGALKTGAELQALDVRFEWDVDRLIPARSLTLLHSRGGLGKTWMMLAAAKAICAGTPFLGLETKRRPVLYIDFENPLPALVERVRLLDIRDVRFWHLSADPRPPKLDGPDWAMYLKAAEPGSLIIFDTLRASHDGEENSDQDAALVMGHLKEVREAGHTILCLSHTTKANERVYRGATTWADLADHVLDFHRHRRGSLEVIDDEDDQDQDALFSLGTGEKTRFAPFRTFLSFDAASGTFNPADDPKSGKLDELAAYIAGDGLGKKQSELVAWAKDELGIRKRDTVLALLKRGEGVRWRSHTGLRNARIYEPI